MPVYQKRIWDIFGDNAWFVKIDFINIIDQIDSFALGLCMRLDYPQRFSTLLVLFFVKEGEKISKFVWQDECFWCNIKRFSSKFLLHSQNINTEFVFSCDFVRAREVIDFLILVKSFIEIRLYNHWNPENVPVMSFCVCKSMSL